MGKTEHYPDAKSLAGPPENGITIILHLCHAAIHKQFRSRDVGSVVGCEEHLGLAPH